MAGKNTTIITDFDANEVSLVRKGANRKVFLIKKSEVKMDLEELLKQLQLSNEKEIEETLASIRKEYGDDEMPEEAMVMLKAASALVGKAHSMMKEGCGVSVSGKGKHISVYKSQDVVLKSDSDKAVADAVALAKADTETLKEQVQKFEKAVALVTDAALKGNIERVMKGEEPVDDTLPDAAKQAIKKAEDEKAELLAKIEKMEGEKKDAEVIAKADSFKNIPAAAKDAAVALLKSAPEQAEVLLKAFDTALHEAKGTVLKEEGANGGSGGASPFEVAVIKKMDGDKTLTREQAVLKVLEANPELYQP